MTYPLSLKTKNMSARQKRNNFKKDKTRESDLCGSILFVCKQLFSKNVKNNRFLLWSYKASHAVERRVWLVEPKN